jgi:hypothetical protein
MMLLGRHSSLSSSVRTEVCSAKDSGEGIHKVKQDTKLSSEAGLGTESGIAFS